MAGTQGILNLQSEICNRIAQRVVALLRAADAVELGQVLDADGDVGHGQLVSRLRRGFPGPTGGWHLPPKLDL